MKEKGLFDAAPETVPDDDPQTHFVSYLERCKPFQAWLEERFGPCVHMGSFKYLECRVHGVHVRVALEEHTSEWCVGFAAHGTKRVGWVSYGPGWEKRVPPAVWLAAEYVKLRGSQS